MAGTMSEADLVADLKASLQDAASVFTVAADGDFKRHLSLAALDMGRFFPRTLIGSLTLVADQSTYVAPAAMVAFKLALWGSKRGNPWEDNWPGKLPRVTLVVNGSVKELHLDPAPSAAQVATLGVDYQFYYYAAHAIGAAASDTTVLPGHRGLLLLRAQAEAMQELTVRNLNKPVQLRDGLSGTPRNSTPAALFSTLMDMFEQRAAA